MRVALCVLASILMALCAAAHEVRPAYLEITETAHGEYDVIWKQPVLDGRRRHHGACRADKCACA